MISTPSTSDHFFERNFVRLLQSLFVCYRYFVDSCILKIAMFGLSRVACRKSDKARIFRDRASGDGDFGKLPPETETSILETVCFVQLRSARKQSSSRDRVSLLY